MLIQATTIGRRTAPAEYVDQTGGLMTLKQAKLFKRGEPMDLDAQTAQHIIAFDWATAVPDTEDFYLTDEERIKDGNSL